MSNRWRKDQFIATLGHELRRPLTPIAHAVYLLRKGHQDPATIELLDTIDAQARALLRFVNELLDLSRISHGLITQARTYACVAEGFDAYLVKPGTFTSWTDCSEATARTLTPRETEPTSLGPPLPDYRSSFRDGDQHRSVAVAAFGLIDRPAPTRTPS